MSADSQMQGLAESQVLSGGDWKTGKEEFEARKKRKAEAEPLDEASLEDPACAWIDLVEAYRNRDLDAAKMAIELAKKSHWTHDLWEEFHDDFESGDDDYIAESGGGGEDFVDV